MKGGFRVDRPGVLTLLQDAGRFGYHRLGLTAGGPADPLAFNWANRLCGNAGQLRFLPSVVQTCH